MRLRGVVAVCSVLLLSAVTHAQLHQTAVNLPAMPSTGLALSSLNADAQSTSAQPRTPASAPPSAQPSASAQASPQPDLVTLKADFIPGEKTLFFDDFSDMAGDEPPPHWKVRDGVVALKVGSGIQQLELVGGDRLRLTPMLRGLPKNFTLETEMKLDTPGGLNFTWYFHDKNWDGPNGPYAPLSILVQAREDSIGIFVRHLAASGPEDIANTNLQLDFNQPVKQAVWVQNGRLRVYINGERVVDVNQLEMPPLTGAELDPEYGTNKLGLRMVRFAESTPDFSQSIVSTGRYVTHGIHFDTDSDRLKLESASVFKLVAAGLQKNPALKLRIEGHTDSTGNTEHNLDLSRRRADAVKAVVSQFGIEEARLTTAGLGATKPIGSNDAPEGRTQNRRVEFVRQ